MFPDDAAAERWFIEQRWPDGICCHYCGSARVQTGCAHKTMPFRCRDCRKRFSVRTGTVMQSSKLGYQTWVIAMYLMTTSLKGVSSMKLHRDLRVTQKTAWHLAHRLREMWRRNGIDPFDGPVEADETYIGGKVKNMHEWQRVKRGGMRGTVGKVGIVGIKDQKTKKISAAVIKSPTAAAVFVGAHMTGDTKLYTDESSAYRAFKNHESVSHGFGEFARGEVTTNGIESFWSMLKRAYVGVFHRMSPEHLHRYVAEFEGRHNARDLDTADQMGAMVRGAEGRRLRYDDLTAHRRGRARAV